MTWLFWIGLIVIIIIGARRRIALTEAFFFALSSRMGQTRLFDLYEPMRRNLGHDVSPGVLHALVGRLEKRGYIRTWLVDDSRDRQGRPDRMVAIINAWEQQ